MAISAVLMDAVDASVSVTGGTYDMADLDKCGIQVVFSGSNLAGTLKLQASNDMVTYVDVTGSSQSITSASSHMWNVTSAEYRYIRAIWTASSGTGTATCTIFLKETVIRGA